MKQPLSLVICIVLPIIILLVGIVFSVVYAVQALPAAFADEHRGVLPPGFDLTLEEPQRYSVWVYSRGIFENQSFQSFDEKLPPGAKIHVIDKKSGGILELSNWLNQTKSTMREAAYSLGSFETIRPATEIEVVSEGLDTQTVVGVSSKNVADIFQAIVAILAIFLTSTFISIATLIILLHRRNKQIQASEAA